MKHKLFFLAYTLAAISCFLLIWKLGIFYHEKPFMAAGCIFGLTIFALYFLVNCIALGLDISE